MGVKIWVDDVRPKPSNYTSADIHCKSVYETIHMIEETMKNGIIDELNLDHDAGDFSKQGGDYIKILDWLEMIENHYEVDVGHYITLFKFHTANTVGKKNMIAICKRNGWNYQL